MKINYSIDSRKINERDLEVTGKMAEDFFKTANDSDQIQVNEQNKKWVIKNNCINIIRDGDKIIGYSLIIPSNKKIMNDFISKKINENIMFERIKKIRLYEGVDALYLAASFIKEDYRGKGLVYEARTKLVEDYVKRIGSKPVLYFWGYTREGTKSCKLFARKNGFKIFERMD